MASYINFTVISAIFLFSVAYLLGTEVINEFIAIVNPFIADGSVTDTFVTYWNFLVGFWQALVIIFIVGLALWAFNRAREQRDIGGY